MQRTGIASALCDAAKTVYWSEKQQYKLLAEIALRLSGRLGRSWQKVEAQRGKIPESGEPGNGFVGDFALRKIEESGEKSGVLMQAGGRGGHSQWGGEVGRIQRRPNGFLVFAI